MCGVLVSDWAGYQSLKKENGGGVTQTGADPAHAMPMSTNPIVLEVVILRC
jgi:hypothetical protein